MIIDNDPLFAGVEIKTHPVVEFYPHRRRCLYCYQWFETTSKTADRCPLHQNEKERKIVYKTYDLNSLPF